MRGKIFLDIIESINENILEKKDSSISSDKFQRIVSKKVDGKIVFIDGGQAELLKGVSFSLQLIRAVAAIFKNNKKIRTKVDEFFVLINAVKDMERIEYRTQIFPVKGDAIEGTRFDSFDATIRDGVERADISKVGDVVRRFAELDLARRIVDELDRGDVIVLDGSLKCLVTGEKERMQRLCDRADERGVIVSALAKTAKIFDDNGGCLISGVGRVSSKLGYAWYYPLAGIKSYGGFIVKLNKNSKYLFEFNIFNKQRDKAEDVLSLLRAYSKDVVFPGYPYGLLLADKFARVSNSEKEYLLTIFQAKAGKSWDRIKRALNALNSHEILDRMG